MAVVCTRPHECAASRDAALLLHGTVNNGYKLLGCRFYSFYPNSPMYVNTKHG